MTIELYVFPPSPRSFKVMAVANHLGLDWMPRFVDLAKGDQRAQDYAALNPNMRAPTLKDGDYVLWELNAIGQYLASKRPESGLLPKDERGRLDVTRWQFWELAHWDQACAAFVFEYVVKPYVIKAGEPDLAAVAKGTELFHRAAKVLDGQLGNRQFVAGGTLNSRRFLARRRSELCRIGASAGRALQGDHALVWYAERIARLAKNRSAIGDARHLILTLEDDIALILVSGREPGGHRARRRARLPPRPHVGVGGDLFRAVQGLPRRRPRQKSDIAHASVLVGEDLRCELKTCVVN